MKSIRPNPEYPLVHIPQIAHNECVPIKSPRVGSRNMTGIYLGLEGNSKPPKFKGHQVPPLARGRGMPRRAQTPTEQRRYRIVEQHRVREERRGFSGQPLKRKVKSASTDITDADSRDEQRLPQHPPQVLDLSRMTTSSFTLSQNDLAVQQQLADTVVEEVHRLAMTKQDLEGLAECYRRVCKGNVDMLYSLLPTKKNSDNQKKRSPRYTGFTVKSYRNPNKAEIISDFPPPSSRPHTSFLSSNQPHVPNPYFYKHQNSPRSAPGANPSPYEDHFPKLSYPGRLVATPGVGGLSQVLPRTRKPASQRVNTPTDYTDHSGGKDHKELFSTSALRGQLYGNPHTTTPADSGVLIPQADLETDQSERTAASPPPDQSEHTVTSLPLDQSEGTATTPLAQESISGDLDLKPGSPPPDTETMAEVAMPRGLQDECQSSSIMIGLVDESGAKAPVEIDETDEEIKKPAETPEDEVAPVVNLNRRVSITERVLKSKNSEQQIQSRIEESLEKRKQELEDLLDEHETIVTELATMQTTDKENHTAGAMEQK